MESSGKISIFIVSKFNGRIPRVYMKRRWKESFIYSWWCFVCLGEGEEGCWMKTANGIGRMDWFIRLARSVLGILRESLVPLAEDLWRSSCWRALFLLREVNYEVSLELSRIWSLYILFSFIFATRSLLHKLNKVFSMELWIELIERWLLTLSRIKYCLFIFRFRIIEIVFQGSEWKKTLEGEKKKKKKKRLLKVGKIDRFTSVPLVIAHRNNPLDIFCRE